MNDRIQWFGFNDTKVQFIVQFFIYFADDGTNHYKRENQMLYKTLCETSESIKFNEISIFSQFIAFFREE